jgi:hypothetical protein
MFSSLKDMGYQQAKTGDSLTEQAKYAIEKIVGFPQDIPAEAREALYAGYQLRYTESHPAEVYAVINGHYVKPTPEQLSNAKLEKIEVGVAYAYSYSQQEFGKLKTTNPALHGIVKKWREDVGDYCSNRLGDLKRAATKLLAKDKPRTRTTQDFVESLTKTFGALEKSVKVKQGRGDTTANETKFKVAIKAFWTSYNK